MGRRWVVIGVGLAAYWSTAGCAVVSARRATPGPWSHEWVAPATLTLPGSLLANQVGEGAPPQAVRAAYTAATVAGGIINGFLFAGFVLWAPRARRSASGVSDDYADAPDGTIPNDRWPPRDG